MKRILMITIVFLAFSCQKSNVNPNGNLTFYMTQPMNTVDVTVNGSTRTITQYYPTGVSGICNSAGCANFVLPAGTYPFSAEESGFFGNTWSGTVTVPANGCQTFLLYE